MILIPAFHPVGVKSVEVNYAHNCTIIIIYSQYGNSVVSITS